MERQTETVEQVSVICVPLVFFIVQILCETLEAFGESNSSFTGTFIKVSFHFFGLCFQITDFMEPV